MKKKVLVLIPTPDTIHPACQKALSEQDYNNFEVMVYAQKVQELSDSKNYNRHLNISRCRNAIKRLAVQSDAEYFMWLDSDMVLPKNGISILMSQLNQPPFDEKRWENLKKQFPNVDIRPQGKHIVSGWYKQREQANLWNAARLVADYTMASLKFVEASLTRVDKIDFGCMLLSREVFQKIDYKTGFNWVINGKRGVCECFMFCKDATDLGYELFMEGSVVCEHKWKGKLTWRFKALLNGLTDKAMQLSKLKMKSLSRGQMASSLIKRPMTA